MLEDALRKRIVPEIEHEVDVDTTIKPNFELEMDDSSIAEVSKEVASEAKKWGEEISSNLFNWTTNTGKAGIPASMSARGLNPSAVVGFNMSAPSGGYTNFGGRGTEEDLSKDIEDGTRNGNRDQNDILNSIMRGIDALLRKNWTVNIHPSSALGAVNSHSNRLYGMVTGETE